MSVKRGLENISGEPWTAHNIFRSAGKFCGKGKTLPQTLQVKPSSTMQMIGQVQGAEGAGAEGAAAATPGVKMPMGIPAGGVPGPRPVQQLATMPDPDRAGFLFHKMTCERRAGQPKEPITTSTSMPSRAGQPKEPIINRDGQPKEPKTNKTLWEGPPQEPIESYVLNDVDDLDGIDDSTVINDFAGSLWGFEALGRPLDLYVYSQFKYRAPSLETVPHYVGAPSSRPVPHGEGAPTHPVPLESGTRVGAPSSGPVPHGEGAPTHPVLPETGSRVGAPTSRTVPHYGGAAASEPSMTSMTRRGIETAARYELNDREYRAPSRRLVPPKAGATSSKPSSTPMTCCGSIPPQNHRGAAPSPSAILPPPGLILVVSPEGHQAWVTRPALEEFFSSGGDDHINFPEMTMDFPQREKFSLCLPTSETEFSVPKFPLGEIGNNQPTTGNPRDSPTGVVGLNSLERKIHQDTQVFSPSPMKKGGGKFSWRTA